MFNYKRIYIPAVPIALAVVALAWLMLGKDQPRSSVKVDAAPITQGGRQYNFDNDASGYGWSFGADTSQAIKTVLGASGADVGRPDIVFVFYSPGHSPEKIAACIRQAVGDKTAILGWASYLGIVAPDGFHDSPDGVIGVLSIRDSSVKCGVGSANLDEAASPGDCAKLAYSRAMAKAGHGTKGPDGTFTDKPSIIMMSATAEGLEEKYIKAMTLESGGDVPILGGSAEGKPDDISTYSLIANERTIRKGIAVAVFFTQEQFGWYFSGGFERTGKSGVITSVDGRIVRTINNRPALDVYNEWSGGRIFEAMHNGSDVTKLAGLYPLCRSFTSGQMTHNLFTHVSPTADAETSRNLKAYSTLLEGDVVHFSEGSWNILLNGIGKLPEQAKQNRSGGPIQGGIFVCCESVIRNIPLDHRDQISTLLNRSLGEIPWMGMFSAGEQGCFRGVGNYHGNLLTSLTLFPGPSAGATQPAAKQEDQGDGGK